MYDYLLYIHIRSNRRLCVLVDIVVATRIKGEGVGVGVGVGQ